MTIRDLPTLNAILNGIAALFLLWGWRAIKSRRDRDFHKKLMLAALATSAVFLASYLYYHFNVELVTRYQKQGFLRYLYFAILFTHIPLAALILPFIGIALWHAYRENFPAHVRIVKWLWPTWIYVSVTGVLVYLMLYVF